MIKVTIDSVRASLLSQHRVVVLKEEGMERYLAIWIGPYEADAITIKLQGVEIARPLTHDLLQQSIDTVFEKRKVYTFEILSVFQVGLQDCAVFNLIVLWFNPEFMGRHSTGDCHQGQNGQGKAEHAKSNLIADHS